MPASCGIWQLRRRRDNHAGVARGRNQAGRARVSAERSSGVRCRRLATGTGNASLEVMMKPDADRHYGAVEGSGAPDEGQGNPNAPAIDAEGLPNDEIAIAEDRIGANVDDSEVSNADEAGRTTKTPREEVKPLGSV